MRPVDKEGCQSRRPQAIVWMAADDPAAAVRGAVGQSIAALLSR